MTTERQLVDAAKVLAPAVALLTAGGIASISYCGTPILRDSAARSSTRLALRQLRALFSSGSHVFPQLGSLAAGLFAYLAYALPAKRTGLGLAALGSIGIAPFTVLVMLPLANQRLIDLDEKAQKQGDAVEKDTREVVALLDKFTTLNAARAGIMAFGGLAGLYTLLL